MDGQVSPFPKKKDKRKSIERFKSPTTWLSPIKSPTPALARNGCTIEEEKRSDNKSIEKKEKRTIKRYERKSLANVNPQPKVSTRREIFLRM